MRKTGKIVKKVLWWLMIIAIIFAIVKIYNKYNYNDFIKNVTQPGKTSFTRDSVIKYSKYDTYKIENKEYHDAMFAQKISVMPNTPYKVSCKVRVDNVVNENNVKTGGAQICINGTTERSASVYGTSSWQELCFYFNSKNKTEVDIGFRLGGYAERSKGTAWFSDFKLEVRYQ